MTTLGDRVDTVVNTFNSENEVSMHFALDFPREANAEYDFRKRNSDRRDEFISKVEALIEEYQL